MVFALLGMIGLKKISDTIDTKIHTYKDYDYETYRDNNGILRYKNGREIVKTLLDGDIIYKDAKSGKIYLNETLKDAKNNEIKAKQHGNNIFLRQPSRSNSNRLGNRSIAGNRYCFINQGYSKCYVVRKVNYKNNSINYYGDYLMDMNYNFISPTNHTIKQDNIQYRNKSSDIHKQIISMLNNKYKNSICLPDSESIIYLGDVLSYKTAHEKIQRWK